MMVRDKREINPVLLKFGAALAVSIAGFLLSRLKTNKNKSSHPPHSPRSPDHSTEVDVGGERAWRRDDLQVTNRTSSSGSLTSISTEIYQLSDGGEFKMARKSHMLMVAVDNSKVFSPSNRQSGDKDGYLLPEFIDLVKEFDFNAHNSGTSPNKDETPRSDVETP
ncbi:hypothetical protein OIU84_004784 [Salix udensis]|uniref:Uncharacterized protein n=1 Tax=Salix udensis TaxID=889485 RepID=A0AAD6P4S8_9ROSI|nr:hypothetical protein OIU84_004784 [Salix udensis]